ncbi:MAG: tRNA dihydrouridine synthase DusB [Candidatus Latescibacteria bacterium]|nr:tRNA dihydrouridine synthase DusB [Candidatus Latescibacterota bacterium]
MATLKIGPIAVSPGLLLAPMEEVTDLPFRSLCRRLGADIVYTEFVNAEGLIRQARRAQQKLEFLEEERPVGIQLYGAAELSMEQAAQIATAQGPDLIDVNCGCWVSDVALRGAGAGLLRDLPRMREVVARVVRSTHLPVTVKTRLGWDARNIRIVEVARMLEDLGVRALTLHCRTRTQGHQGAVDYSWVPRIKAAVSIPVILNGDVVAPQDVQRAFAETGCDGVMIGRGAIQNPWIFRQTHHYLNTSQLLPLPSLAERASLCLEHLRLAVARKGPSAALAGLRRHYAGYFRGLPGAAALRAELGALKEFPQVEERLRVLAAQTDSLLAA